MWFSLDDMIKKRYKFKFFYKETVDLIIDNYKQIKDITLHKKI